MCGTVAWLQGKACGDDEQFDLAAWFPSLAYSWSLDQLYLFMRQVSEKIFVFFLFVSKIIAIFALDHRLNGLNVRLARWLLIGQDDFSGSRRCDFSGKQKHSLLFRA